MSAKFPRGGGWGEQDLFKSNDILLCIAYEPHKLVQISRGPYMSAHVLSTLLNKLGKRDKMRGLPSILSILCNAFYKFNNTRARMLDSIYHMTLRIF